jgi:hypothetical protein
VGDRTIGRIPALISKLMMVLKNNDVHKKRTPGQYSGRRGRVLDLV